MHSNQINEQRSQMSSSQLMKEVYFWVLKNLLNTNCIHYVNDTSIY